MLYSSKAVDGVHAFVIKRNYQQIPVLLVAAGKWRNALQIMPLLRMNLMEPFCILPYFN
jgi:hypothetical protein